MEVDKKYCMSSFLMYRAIVDETKCFSKNYLPSHFKLKFPRKAIANSFELEDTIRNLMKEWTDDGKSALALSGGIDSAVLAKFMPKGSKVYTFQCIVPGKEVTNEVPQASKYVKECGLEHEIVKIYWEDMKKYAPLLMKSKGAPIHSIEVQIYKAALKAKADGYERLIFGETSDINYGGLDKFFFSDWTVGNWLERYCYVMPYLALKDFEVITEPLKVFEKNGIINVHEFLRNFTLKTSMGSYINACKCAEIEFKSPYLMTYLSEPLDYKRIQNGESKYIVREIFKRLYPNMEVPVKISMPRPMNEWFSDWNGPTREEFWEQCTKYMNGDQKWLVWALEKFLDICDGKE